MEMLTIQTRRQKFIVPLGKPVICQWKSTNKSRKGISTAIGWIKQGEKPHTIHLIHSAFQTWDKVEQEYCAHWTVWASQILDIRPLSTR